MFGVVSRGQAAPGAGKGGCVSAHAGERWEERIVVRKPAGKVGGIVYPKHNGAERAGNIVFCEGAARQEKPVTVAIAAGVVTADCAWAIDASSFGKTHGVIRVDDRRAKATIAEPDKTARHSVRIDE